MQNLLQHAQNGERQSKWMRLVAILCMVLVCAASTVQACHRHGEHPLKQHSQQNGTTPESHCPLCVAMHSAMPAAQHVVPEPVIHVRAVNSIAVETERVFRWRFETASRPPPAHLNRA